MPVYPFVTALISTERKNHAFPYVERRILQCRPKRSSAGNDLPHIQPKTSQAIGCLGGRIGFGISNLAVKLRDGLRHGTKFRMAPGHDTHKLVRSLVLAATNAMLTPPSLKGLKRVTNQLR